MVTNGASLHPFDELLRFMIGEHCTCPWAPLFLYGIWGNRYRAAVSLSAGGGDFASAGKLKGNCDDD